MTYRRSAYCSSNGCIEVEFRSASSCASSGCVECAEYENSIFVRDSKDPDGPVLRFTRDEWTAFLQGIKAGEFG